MPSTPHISIRATAPPQPAVDTTVSASAAAMAGELITVSATMQRTPSASTARRQLAVGAVDHERARDIRVHAGDADDRRLVAELGEHAVGRPLQRLPAMIGDTATT